jgi:hypothetical protein
VWTPESVWTPWWRDEVPAPAGNKSRDSSVNIALGYRPDDRSSRVRFLAGVGNFSLHHRVQNGSGAHPDYYPMGTRGSFPGDKATREWSWQLTSISCRGQRMSGAIPQLPQYAFMTWCLVKHTDNFTFYFWPCRESKNIIMATNINQWSNLTTDWTSGFLLLQACFEFFSLQSQSLHYFRPKKCVFSILLQSIKNAISNIPTYNYWNRN